MYIKLNSNSIITKIANDPAGTKPSFVDTFCKILQNVNNTQEDLLTLVTYATQQFAANQGETANLNITSTLREAVIFSK